MIAAVIRLTPFRNALFRVARQGSIGDGIKPVYVKVVNFMAESTLPLELNGFLHGFDEGDTWW